MKNPSAHEQTLQQVTPVRATCCALNVYLGKHEKSAFWLQVHVFFHDLKGKFCSTKLKNALFVVNSQQKASSLV